MSNYTTELRFICETLAGEDESVGYNSVNTVIEKARPKIFNFTYPIFDTAYKKTLETKILKHYYTREICAETYARWKLFLDARLNEIMPRYNKLYESELLSFNPLYDADYTREGNRNVDNTTDDNQITTTDGSTVQTDNRTSTTTLSGTDTRTIADTLSGQDTTTISTELGGRDTSTTENETGGTDSTTSTSRDGGSDTTHRENEPYTDQWTYYSDTPQGGVNGMNLADDMYLSNATHVTQSGAGSTDDSTSTYGKTNTTNGSTNYGKTSDTTETTDYGQTTDTESTTAYGKRDNTTDTQNYGKVSTQKDTGTTKHDTDSTVTANRDVNSNTDEDYAEHVVGKFPGKSYSKLLQEFRETFLNIDLMVINDLSDLFFGLWE